MFALVSIGEVMAEIRRSADATYHVGFAGDTYNTAVYCSRLLDTKGSVAYVSRIGTDPLSESWLSDAVDEGVDNSFGFENNIAQRFRVFDKHSDNDVDRQLSTNWLITSFDKVVR